MWDNFSNLDHCLKKLCPLNHHRPPTTFRLSHGPHTTYQLSQESHTTWWLSYVHLIFFHHNNTGPLKLLEIHTNGWNWLKIMRKGKTSWTSHGKMKLVCPFNDSENHMIHVQTRLVAKIWASIVQGCQNCSHLTIVTSVLVAALQISFMIYILYCHEEPELVSDQPWPG